MPNLPLYHWSRQLFDLRAPLSADVLVQILNQPINVYKAATISLFWSLSGVDELPELPFRISVHPDSQFLTGQSRCFFKSLYTVGGPEPGFWRCFVDRLNQSLVLSVMQAITGHSSF